MCFAELKTKKARIEFIREKLKTDDRWMLKGLIVIFDNQTHDEQRVGSVHVHNGIGFTRADAEIMSDFAKRLIARGLRQALAEKQPVSVDKLFTVKQAAIFKKKIAKYANQLAKEAEQKSPLPKKGGTNGAAE
jgi:hypothetical protein